MKMPVTGCHSALDAESRFSFFWIPAGVYPREDGGENDDKQTVKSVIPRLGGCVVITLKWKFMKQFLSPGSAS